MEYVIGSLTVGILIAARHVVRTRANRGSG